MAFYFCFHRHGQIIMNGQSICAVSIYKELGECLERSAGDSGPQSPGLLPGLNVLYV